MIFAIDWSVEMIDKFLLLIFFLLHLHHLQYLYVQIIVKIIVAAVRIQHTAQTVTIIIAAFAPAERLFSIANPQKPEKSA